MLTDNNLSNPSDSIQTVSNTHQLTYGDQTSHGHKKLLYQSRKFFYRFGLRKWTNPSQI